MSKLRIRQTDDLETIAELDIQLFPNEPLKEGYDLLNDSVWWVAEAFMEGEWTPVAYAGLEVTDSGAKAFLSRAGVLPIAQGQRLQRKLIAARLRYCKAQGIPRAWTYTHWANIRSQRSLVSSGFKPYYYAREESGADFLHFIYYEKKLTAK